jgi:hypothetical protein
MRRAYNLLAGKLEGRMPFGRPRCKPRCEDNIHMDLKEIRYEDVGWFQLTQCRVQLRDFVNIVMKLRVP